MSPRRDRKSKDDDGGHHVEFLMTNQDPLGRSIQNRPRLTMYIIISPVRLVLLIVEKTSPPRSRIWKLSVPDEAPLPRNQSSSFP